MPYQRPHSLAKLCTAAVLLALGILLPQVFHLVGGAAAGSIFLPMHIPVLLCGMLAGPLYGLALGVLTPILSFLLTGMPSAARLPFMLLELAAYGFFSGFFSAKKWNLYLGLICSQAAGRLAYALALMAAGYALRLEVPPAASVFTALITGLPGIVMQLVFIPPTVYLLRRVMHLDTEFKTR